MSDRIRDLECKVDDLTVRINKIKAAFPEMSPSGGQDYVDEIIGLLRVARLQRDMAEKENAALRQRIEKR